jgi:hypothetical protein
MQFVAMGKTESRLFAIAATAAILTLLPALEALSAVFAQSCANSIVVDGCYPWGTEGPAAGSWRYASKSNYLLSGFLPLLVELSIIAILLGRARKDAMLARWQMVLLAVAIGAPFLLLLI